MGFVNKNHGSFKFLNIMNKKVLIILIISGLLVSMVSCGTADKEKRNYTLCRQRIIEYSKTLDPDSDSYAEKLRQKATEYFNIYGFRGTAEFEAAKNKYEEDLGKPADREKLTEILKQIGAVSSGDTTQPVLPEEPEGKEEETEESTSPGEFSGIESKAVSLKVLLQKLQEYHGERNLPVEIAQLGGLTSILGYMTDKANNDIILLGDVDKTSPPLYLDDFVVALRNAWFKYTELKGNTRYYSNPGCSIDPDPKVLKQLDDVSSRFSSSRKVEEKEKSLKQWEKVCASPQQVRVMGVPFHSHFGWVMVKADYDMKRIVDGSDSLDLPGFKSLVDIELDLAKAEIMNGQSASVPGASMNRFWFYPGKTHFLEDDGMVLIDACDVLLLTEEEFLTHKGDVAGTGRPNKNAQVFAAAFSALYSEVAALRPIYRELDNMFRFVALTKALKFKAAFEEVDLNIEYLLERYPVSEKRVEESLPGIANVKRFEYRRDVADGYETGRLWLPSCGGVSADIEVDESSFGKPPSDDYKKVRDNVSEAKSSVEELSWIYKCIFIREADVDRLREINRLNKDDFSTFTVVNHLSKYKLFHTSDNSVLDSNSKVKLLEAVMEHAGDNKIICLDLKGFSEQEAELFVYNLQLIAIARNIDAFITGIPRSNDSAELLELVCKPVDGIKTPQKGKSKLERVKQGGLSGWFRRRMEFFLRKGSKTKQTEMGFLAKEPQQLIDLYEAIQEQISSSKSSKTLMKDINRALKKLIKQSKGKTYREIIIEIIRQLRKIDFGYLRPGDVKGKLIVKTAA